MLLWVWCCCTTSPPSLFWKYLMVLSALGPPIPPVSLPSLFCLNLLHLLSAFLQPAAVFTSVPPLSSCTLGWERWSQVGLQTWVMWLRLTHTPRHQPSVWSQQWHKHKSKHTHTHIRVYTESTHRQTDLVVPTIWNPVMQVAIIIITLYDVIIIEKLEMNPSAMRSDCKQVCDTNTHTHTHTHKSVSKEVYHHNNLSLRQRADVELCFPA